MSTSLVQDIRTELRIAWTLIATNVRASAEFRIAFAMQIFGMAVNDLAFLAVWIIFFTASGPINGWSVADIIALQGFAAAAYGIAFTLGEGARDLPALVRTGTLDGFLTSPRTIALRIWTSKSSVSAIGDIVYGLALLAVAVVLHGPGIERIAITVMLLLPASVLFATMVLAASLPSFLLPDGDGVAGNLLEVFLSPALNPSGVLTGGLRAFFIFVVPAITAASLPAEALRSLNWSTVALVWVITAAWLAITLFLLHRGLRRYESGNLTGART